MKTVKIVVLALVAALGMSIDSLAQSYSVKAVLQEDGSDETVAFATVSLTVPGKDKAYKYTLSSAEGNVLIEGVKKGKYVFKAENMGYIAVSRNIEIKDGDVDLGKILMKTDSKMLDAANVSAVGNSILMKKDTIEFNANAFKTTENDVLEDLLKKLPGVEVAEDGSVTVNGQTISKITIDGKTFFLNDPQLATKNIPAKIVNKIKVIEKKSEQAEFTGIDDGEQEQIIDLSVKPGMMNGFFGNASAGAGHDVPSTDVQGDWRYQGSTFMGKFSEDTQIGIVANANNTNNRGFNDMAGSMMGGMMGGGGPMGGGRGMGNRSGNGITSSYMLGGNVATSLFDDKMDIAGNYLYNNTRTDVIQNTDRTTYLNDYNRNNKSNGSSFTGTYGNRIGMRLDHKFSENTSILFEPSINFGGGSYTTNNIESTSIDDLHGNVTKQNEANTLSDGSNKNVSASGFALLRQRLGIPGRTLTVMGRYSISNNNLVGENLSNTKFFDGTPDNPINQYFDNNQKNYSMFVRTTFTEPLGRGFYVEANYAYNWNRSLSDKQTYSDLAHATRDDQYSNNVENLMRSQTIGANVMYQKDGVHAQLGFSAIPTNNYNKTMAYDSSDGKYKAFEYDPGLRWNFSPQAMVWAELNENCNFRLFYRGNTNQPGVNKLMTVPDVSNPLSISFGNTYLNPYFSHNMNGDFRYNNKKNFSSMNIRFNGSLVQDPIVNAIWYGANGAEYKMPFNGPASANVSGNMFLNTPIAKSNFSISNMLRLSWNKSGYYVAKNPIDMSLYDAGQFYAFIEDFLAQNKYRNITESGDFMTNSTRTVSATERMNVKYNNDYLEIQLSGRTRVNKSWYQLGDEVNDNTMTFNNQVRGSFQWNWEAAGLTMKSECNYNWYNGYQTAQPSEFVLDAEIQKSLFHKLVTLSLKGYDILGQAKNLSVSDESNYHSEVYNNTLGRYIIVGLTFRFGKFDRGSMRGGPGMGGPGMGGPGMGPRR